MTYCGSIEEAITDTALCFIFTEWPAVKAFDVEQYAKLMKTPIIIDGRNCYGLAEVKDFELIYDSIGRRTVNKLRISEIPSIN